MSLYGFPVKVAIGYDSLGVFSGTFNGFCLSPNEGDSRFCTLLGISLYDLQQLGHAELC